MAFISVTRLRVRSFLHWPGFMLANEASVRQLRKTPGLITGKELMDKNLTFWTLTIWDSPDAMKAFRNSLPHRKAMQKLPGWCDEAAYIHWEQPEPVNLSWKDVHEKLVAGGKTTFVRHPSAQHLAQNYPAPKWQLTVRQLR